MERNRLAAAIRLVAAQARERLGPHPDVALLVAYCEDSLDDQARDQLRDHFALCPDCARSYLALRSFLDEVAEADASLSPEQLAADWGTLRERLCATGLLPDHPTEADANGGRRQPAPPGSSNDE